MLMDFFHSPWRLYAAAHSWVFFLSKLFFFQFNFDCLFIVCLEMLVFFFFVCFIPLDGFVSPLITFPWKCLLIVVSICIATLMFNEDRCFTMAVGSGGKGVMFFMPNHEISSKFYDKSIFSNQCVSCFYDLFWLLL